MTKQETYEEVLTNIRYLTSSEEDMIANMANTAAILHSTFNFWWTGFYIVKYSVKAQREELLLGPFQGPIACTRIEKGKGVCGTAWLQAQTIIVPNVYQFRGHIACSSESKSEIVVPIIKEGIVMAVLDIDSNQYNTFDQTDKKYLEQVVSYLSK